MDVSGYDMTLGRHSILQVALASIGDAVIVTDEKGHVSFLNAIAESLTGWAVAEARQQPLTTVFRIINERTRAPADHPVGKVLQTGLIQGLANHTILLSKDGREIPIDDSAAPIKAPDGRVIGVVLVFRDITERRGWERRAAWLASIVESSDDAIISKNIDGTITSWNPAAERLFGYGATEIIGKPVMTIVPPELREQERDILTRLQRGERIEHFDTIRLTRDGRRVDVSITISPIKDSEGEIVGASKICRDIRSRKEFEHRLREERRLKDEFLATLAHELRNPLAPIYTSAEFLARSSVDAPGRAAAISVIQRQVRQLTRLVDDLLDIARITQGRITLQTETIDVAEAVAQGVESVAPMLWEKGHQLIEMLTAERLFIRGDKARVVQCISNVVGNAAKYTPPGGQIRLTTRAEDDHVIIEIADNGCGIAVEMLPRVFDIFVQGARDADRAPGGLGIGLTMVKRLAEMQGGRVEVRSPGPGRGTTVEIRLPRIEAPSALVAEESVTNVSQKRVFIVDDNADAAHSLALLLQIQGHSVLAVHSPREALDEISAFKPDVVLLDIGLPQMDGYELIARLKQIPGVRAAKFVALTGYGQPEDKERARHAGFDSYLVKPVSLGALVRALDGG